MRRCLVMWTVHLGAASHPQWSTSWHRFVGPMLPSLRALCSPSVCLGAVCCRTEYVCTASVGCGTSRWAVRGLHLSCSTKKKSAPSF